jgi:hypothetical protein
MNQKTLQEWLSTAYENQGECPPPESWLEQELAGLSAGERQELEIHAESCPRCAAERLLAESFEQDEMDLSQSEIAGLISKLGTPDAGKIAEFPTQPAKKSNWPVRWAIAASLVLAAGLTFQLIRSQPPALPDAPRIEVTRSTSLELLQPIGEVSSVPEEMQWSAFEGAELYRLIVTAVDGAILWELTTGEVEVAIPAEIQAKFLPGVTYSWSVEALQSSHAVIGRSESRQFRIRPGGGA